MTETTETPTPEQIAERLEYLRGEIHAERISWGELAELQGLAEHIEPGDVELLEWADVPEFPDEPTACPDCGMEYETPAELADHLAENAAIRRAASN